ncbi:MAG TPA: type II toxin-antitoxin system HigB family toxin [Niabella sp.]|nr:type II toxin-antitoxin system HigB family toxin [Niabella sp.]
MRIFTEQTLKQFSERHPEAKTALQEWAKIVKRSEWTNFADIKSTFNTVDNVGNGRYVFNIKGNSFRIVAVIRFQIQFVYIRFVGTHKEYDTVNDIKNI